jgi:hypothetical protein
VAFDNINRGPRKVREVETRNRHSSCTATSMNREMMTKIINDEKAYKLRCSSANVFIKYEEHNKLTYACCRVAAICAVPIR